MISAFIDSDVIVSSLISDAGAAYTFLHKPNIKRIVSNYSLVELKRVIKRLGLKTEPLHQLIEGQCEVVKLGNSLPTLRQEYIRYVADENDAHIVAGAAFAQTDFLISYNLKHYKTNKIRQNLDIIVYSPGKILQHLRST